jgi:hypothetical protein
MVKAMTTATTHTHSDVRLPSPQWGVIFYFRCEVCGRERLETHDEAWERARKQAAEDRMED